MTLLDVVGFSMLQHASLLSAGTRLETELREEKMAFDTNNPKTADAPFGDENMVHSYGVIRDEAIIWRARPYDVTVRRTPQSLDISLWFENRIAAACLAEQIQSGLKRFVSSPLVATLVLEVNSAFSCHVTTDPAMAIGSEMDELSGSTVRHIEVPLRVPGVTIVAESLSHSLLADSCNDQVRILFHVSGGGVTDLARFQCRRLQIVRRQEVSSEECPIIGPPGRFQESLGDFSATVLDEEIWAHAPKYMESCHRRSLGTMPEMDCARQLVDLLRRLVPPRATLLDIGCGAGHYYLGLRDLEIEYYGIDTFQAGIRIGQCNLKRFGLHPNRLQTRSIETMSRIEQYDVVVAFNLLSYMPDFHMPLEKMTQSCQRILAIRASFGDETTVRWVPDFLLADGQQDLRMYQNIYSRRAIGAFLSERGFEYQFIPDRRQAEVWGGKPEIVGGVSIPYEILLAQRR